MSKFISELESKVKDCDNTNTIFDTRKYVLLEDAKDILSKALNIDSVSNNEDRVVVCDCVIPKPKDPYDNYDKHICSDCGGRITTD